MSRRLSIGSIFTSVWDWSKLQKAPQPWLGCALFSFAILFQGVLYLPLLLSFAGFAFRDAGSGLVADQLIHLGLLPAVDFGYYHGLLPLMLGRLWFSVFGATPYAYVTLRIVAFILSAILLFYLFRAIHAPRIVYVMFCAAIPFIFFYRPSTNHDLAALGIILSLLLLVQQRCAGAVVAALASAFCHPSLGYVMLMMIGIVAGWSSLRVSPGAFFRTALRLTMTAVAALAVYAAACLAFFRNATPLMRTLFPSVGGKVRAHYHWSFLKGGLTFIHPAGSNWKYVVGTNSASYVIFNMILVAVGVALLVQLFRKRPHANPAVLTLFFCCLTIHAIYVVFVYGVPETWAYDAYLLVLGIATVPFARTRHIAALILTGTLMVGSYSALSAARRIYPQPRRAGLWIDSSLDQNLSKMLERQPRGKPYLWSISGALSMIDDRFRSPARWFAVWGTNPSAELARLKGELLANDVIFLEGPAGDPNYLFQNPDFDDVTARFQQVDTIGDFVVFAKHP